MKKLYKYIVLVIGILVFSACTDENDFPGVDVGGNDVTLNLSLKPEISKEIVNSRATNDENKLYDLHIYVFNANGDLTGYEKLESETGYIIPADNNGNIPTDEDDDYNTVPQDITIRTKTGASYIYAVANINRGSIYKLSEPDKALLNVTTYATNGKTSEQEVNVLRETVEASTLNMTTFKNINFNRTLPTANEVISPSPIDKIFMMSGYLNDGAAVTIQKNGTNVSIKEGVNVIKLYRILAKNTLTIQSVGNGVFTPKSYRLYNVPVGGQLVPNTNISTANTAAGYTTEKTTSANVESHYVAPLNESSFTFYYPENLQAATSNITTWKDRETNSYATGNKTYTNAPANAAYIEIQGYYEDATNKITANATYTIHLGNFSKSLTDFNVVRNNHYIYTVKVNGVNDIVAEAKIKDNNNNDVDNPYAEGMVIKVGNGQFYNVDAHYEARVMAFNMADIWALRNNDKGYILSVETPFANTNQIVYVKSNGVYSLNGQKLCEINDVGAIFTGTPDYEWIKFVKNTDSNKTNADNTINEYTCKYPGDTSRYNSSTNPGGWMNVFELLADLHEKASETNKDIVYYTCFIDENYYADKAWSAYVNREPRTMQIANNLSISTDKKSVYAEVAYSISQRSIATFYKDNSLVAFGTEIYDEEDLFHTTANPTRLGMSSNTDLYDNLPIKNSDDEDAFWDGYNATKNTNIDENFNKWYENATNTVTIITSNGWWGTQEETKTLPINVNNIKNIQPLYLSSAKACMSRNRDLDGDGNIDANEVRWYLASAGQYHALYIAQTSLPVDSWVISDSEMQAIDDEYRTNGWSDSGHDFRGKYHYYTSSPRSGAGTYWPEEGMTNNGIQATGSFIQRAELVRCVRTLKSNDIGLQKPQKYYTFTNNIFDLSGIETRRATINGTLPNHHELQELNELSSKFEVATNSLYGSESCSLLELTGNEDDPCSTYSQSTELDSKGNPIDRGTWRTPNQKEVALMLAEIPSQMQARRHGTRTRFSSYISDNSNSVSWHGPYHWHTRYAFSVTTKGKFNVTGDNAKVDIRCVRDVN